MIYQLFCAICARKCITGMQLRQNAKGFTYTIAFDTYKLTFPIGNDIPEQWSSDTCPHDETRIELNANTN